MPLNRGLDPFQDGSLKFSWTWDADGTDTNNSEQENSTLGSSSNIVNDSAPNSQKSQYGSGVQNSSTAHGFATGDDFTLCFWGRITDLDERNMVTIGSTFGGDSVGVGWYDGKIGGFFGGTYYNFGDETEIGYHHFALTYDGATVSWYRDHVELYTATVDVNTVATDPVSMYMGASDCFQADITVFNRILTTQERQDLADDNFASGADNIATPASSLLTITPNEATTHWSSMKRDPLDPFKDGSLEYSWTYTDNVERTPTIHCQQHANTVNDLGVLGDVVDDNTAPNGLNYLKSSGYVDHLSDLVIPLTGHVDAVLCFWLYHPDNGEDTWVDIVLGERNTDNNAGGGATINGGNPYLLLVNNNGNTIAGTLTYGWHHHTVSIDSTNDKMHLHVDGGFEKTIDFIPNFNNTKKLQVHFDKNYLAVTDIMVFNRLITEGEMDEIILDDFGWGVTAVVPETPELTITANNPFFPDVTVNVDATQLTLTGNEVTVVIDKTVLTGEVVVDLIPNEAEVVLLAPCYRGEFNCELSHFTAPHKVNHFTETSIDTLDSWIKGDNLPINMQRHQAFLTENRVYVLGEYDNEKVGYWAEIVNGVIGAWTSQASMGIQNDLIDQRFLGTKNRGFLFGGYVGGGVYQDVNYRAEYTFTNGVSSGGVNNTPRLAYDVQAGFTFITKNIAYYVGGYEKADDVATVKTQSAPIDANGDIGTWTQGLDLFTGTYDGEILITENRVYLIGGYNGSNAISTLQYATINEDGTLSAWQNANNNLPSANRRMQIVSTRNRVFVMGGDTTTVYTAPIDSSGVIGAWTACGTLPEAMVWTQSVVTESRIYLLGDYASPNTYYIDFADGWTFESDNYEAKCPVTNEATIVVVEEPTVINLITNQVYWIDPSEITIIPNDVYVFIPYRVILEESATITITPNEAVLPNFPIELTEPPTITLTSGEIIQDPRHFEISRWNFADELGNAVKTNTEGLFPFADASIDVIADDEGIGHSPFNHYAEITGTVDIPMGDIDLDNITLNVWKHSPTMAISETISLGDSGTNRAFQLNRSTLGDGDVHQYATSIIGAVDFNKVRASLLIGEYPLGVPHNWTRDNDGWVMITLSISNGRGYGYINGVLAEETSFPPTAKGIIDSLLSIYDYGNRSKIAELALYHGAFTEASVRFMYHRYHMCFVQPDVPPTIVITNPIKYEVASIPFSTSLFLIPNFANTQGLANGHKALDTPTIYISPLPLQNVSLYETEVKIIPLEIRGAGVGQYAYDDFTLAEEYKYWKFNGSLSQEYGTGVNNAYMASGTEQYVQKTNKLAFHFDGASTIEFMNSASGASMSFSFELLEVPTEEVTIVKYGSAELRIDENLTLSCWNYFEYHRTPFIVTLELNREYRLLTLNQTTDLRGNLLYNILYVDDKSYQLQQSDWANNVVVGGTGLVADVSNFTMLTNQGGALVTDYMLAKSFQRNVVWDEVHDETAIEIIPTAITFAGQHPKDVRPTVIASASEIKLFSGAVFNGKSTSVRPSSATVIITPLQQPIRDVAYQGENVMRIIANASIAQPVNTLKAVSIGGVDFTDALLFSGSSELRRYISSKIQAIDGSTVIFNLPIKSGSREVSVETSSNSWVTEECFQNLKGLINDNYYKLLFNDGSYVDCQFNLINHPLVAKPIYEGSCYYKIKLELLI